MNLLMDALKKAEETRSADAARDGNEPAGSMTLRGWRFEPVRATEDEAETRPAPAESDGNEPAGLAAPRGWPFEPFHATRDEAGAGVIALDLPQRSPPPGSRPWRKDPETRASPWMIPKTP